MKNSLRLFSVRGIEIKVHITFPLILVWGAIQFGVLSRAGLEGALFGVIVTLLLFGIVVLHELGHSYAAMHYGVLVQQIVLLPIGGVAQLSRMPEKPIQEFVIAIAGPLVNFALAAILWMVGLAAGLTPGADGLSALVAGFGRADMQGIFNYVFVSNLFLALFNLIPAFPMDGGRVLRALLATRLDFARATALAVAVGQGLAWMMGLWGFLGGGFFLILVAFFIYTGASQEGRLAQVRNVLRDLTVERAYSRQAKSLLPSSTLREAIDLTLHSFQADFPVCEESRLVGMLTHTRLLEALHHAGPDESVASFMIADVTPVRPGEGLFAAQQRLVEEHMDALPVVEHGRFLGLVTVRDINEVYRLMSSWPDLRKRKDSWSGMVDPVNP